MASTLSVPSKPKTFHHFSQLPAELQLKIWEATCAGQSMHVFDVCFPSDRGSARSLRAFTRRCGLNDLAEEDRLRYSKYKSKVFLDAIEVSDGEASTHGRIPRHRVDPSVYRLRDTLRATCLDSSAATFLSETSAPENADVNTVYLPGSNRYIRYDNRTDVLHLRLRAENAARTLAQDTILGGPDPAHFAGIGESFLEIDLDVEPIPDSIARPDWNDDELPYLAGFSPVLDGVWSKELSETLFSARRIALDISETWTDSSPGALVIEEVGFLACTMQHDIEVLYLVDYCVGRCTACRRDKLGARHLQKRDGLLNTELHGESGEEMTRPADVIFGVGKVYREVFDLERLGWDSYHPTFAFARIIDEAIKSQQADAPGGKVTFRGVRILVAEDEPLDGVDTSIIVDCGPDGTRADRGELSEFNELGSLVKL